MHLLVGCFGLHVLEVLSDRAREKLWVLRDEPDLPAHPVVAEGVGGDFVDEDETAVLPFEPCPILDAACVLREGRFIW